MLSSLNSGGCLGEPHRATRRYFSPQYHFSPPLSTLVLDLMVYVEKKVAAVGMLTFFILRVALRAARPKSAQAANRLHQHVMKSRFFVYLCAV